MQVEVIYRLAPGVRARDVDLSFESKKVAISEKLNPNASTLVQVFNGWFNVKVALVEADGTTVLKDFANHELVKFFTSSYNHLGKRRLGASSFIFGFSQKFGQMSIKVVSQEPNEKPVLITHQHLFRGPKCYPVPKLTLLEGQKEYPLPYTNDCIFDEQQRDLIGVSGTIIHVLDKNKQVIADQSLLNTDLKEFDHGLRLALTRRKTDLNRRTDGEHANFYKNSIDGEIANLSKTSCLTLFGEIGRRNLFPEVIDHILLRSLVDRLEYLDTIEAAKTPDSSEKAKDTELKEALITLLKDKLQKYEKDMGSKIQADARSEMERNLAITLLKEKLQKSEKQRTTEHLEHSECQEEIDESSEFPEANEMSNKLSNEVSDELSDDFIDAILDETPDLTEGPEFTDDLNVVQATKILRPGLNLDFQADGSDIFIPDDFLTMPGTAKRLKLA